MLVPLLVTIGVAGLALWGGHHPDVADTGQRQGLRGPAGLDPYSNPIPDGQEVSLEAARKLFPQVIPLPQLAGSVDDSSLVDVWLNDSEVFVEYPQGLFVIVTPSSSYADDPGTTFARLIAQAGRGEIRQIGDAISLVMPRGEGGSESIALAWKDVRVSIVSLEDSYSDEDLVAIANSVAAEHLAMSPAAS